MRVLFVKLSSIGDVVHTLPTLAAVKRKLPNVEISWVVEQRSAEILRNNPLLSRLIEVDTSALRRGELLGKTLKTAKSQLRELRALEFDLAIDFQGLLKSASITKLAKAKAKFGFSKRNLREPASRVLLKNSIDVEPKQNVIYKNLELAEKVLRASISEAGFSLDLDRLEYPIACEDDHRDEARKIADRTGPDFAILNPAGGWVTKLWPAENYGLLSDMLWERLGIASVISTAPNEIELANRVLESSRSGNTSLAQPSLKGFFELARQARVYVGGDTAPTHIAVGADCPIVGIFGPTEWWRNGSPKRDDICVARRDIDCRIDCHRRTCDKWICMEIEPETVFNAITKRLNETDPNP